MAEHASVSRSDTGQRPERLRERLTSQTGRAAIGDIGTANSTVLRRMAASLIPVIGARGFEAILSRALHQTNLTFPSISVVPGGNGPNNPAGNIALRFDTGDLSQADEASAALLLNFTKLLTNLIGGALTEQLIGPIAADSASTTGNEPAT